MSIDIMDILIYPIYTHDFKELVEMVFNRLTRGGRKYNGPAFSAGQWPSLACKDEKKWAALRTAVVAVSYVISSPSSTFTCGIVCLKFFSLKNCRIKWGLGEEQIQKKKVN